MPVTSAVAVVPSRNSTTSRWPPSTTCRLVRMCPLRSITMPLPAPVLPTRIRTIEGMTRSTRSGRSGSASAGSRIGVGVLGPSAVAAGCVAAAAVAAAAVVGVGVGVEVAVAGCAVATAARGAASSPAMFTASRPPSVIEATMTMPIAMALIQVLCRIAHLRGCREDSGCEWWRAADPPYGHAP